MPGRRCTVAVCKNSAFKTKGLGIVYHRFPKDVKLKSVWIQRCKRDGKWNADSCYVCSDHFLEEDYQDGEEEGSRVKRPRAPAIRDLDFAAEQDLDERNGPSKQPSVPPGFLSPSVKEYLELGKSIPGRPGSDYPVLSMVPYTDFYCEDQPYPGFFADTDTRCQAWHYCDIDGRQTTFLCPNGTQFSQAVFVCDWWFNVRCELSKQLYPINARLYRRPKLSPTRPHRIITKQLLDNIFV